MRIRPLLCIAGVACWAREYLRLALCVCVALMCIHAAALHTKQVGTSRCQYCWIYC